MKGVIILYLTVGLAGCLADFNITDYVYWKKLDINRWDTFFPSRNLQEERLTIKAANEAVGSLSANLKESLTKIVAFQYREMAIAQQLMSSTPAEGCLNGISNVLDQTINDQLEAYQDCSADAQSKLSRFNSNLDRVNASYLIAYQRAIAGIDTCVKNYPNKDSIDRLISCVESMNKNYISVANNTQNYVVPSPSMAYFKSVVVDCSSQSAQAVAKKGRDFLNMLVNCASLSGTVDPDVYAQELSQWKGYNDTLSNQINASQSFNYDQIQNVEAFMKVFYQLQKEALEKNVIETRGLTYYQNSLFSYLADYYNTVTATTLDNPGEPECTTAAKTSLDNIVTASAHTSLDCDQGIVDSTKQLVNEVYGKFLNINSKIPFVGNVAVLECISQGYIFAPDTILKCFQLTYSQFEIDLSDNYDIIIKDSLTLKESISTFFNNSNLPCGNLTLKRAFLGAEEVLFDLQRCLYKSSGNTYEVTTPVREYITTRHKSTTTKVPVPTTTEEYTSTEISIGVTTTVDYTTTTTENVPIKTSTIDYNNTTEDVPFNTTTIDYTSTTEDVPFNTSTIDYNSTTTEDIPCNTTTTDNTSTTEDVPFNTTTIDYTSTTEDVPFNTTTTNYTSTTEWIPFNTTTIDYNSTTEWIPYNITTTVDSNSTTEYAIYNTTTQRYSSTTTQSPDTPTTPKITTTTRRSKRRTTTTRRPGRPHPGHKAPSHPKIRPVSY